MPFIRQFIVILILFLGKAIYRTKRHSLELTIRLIWSQTYPLKFIFVYFAVQFF